MSLDAMILLLAMRTLNPYADPALAEAIVASGATWEEATWLVGIGYRESGYRLRAVGDRGRSLCAYQLQGAPRAVLTDAGLCTRLALRALRASAALCPTQPLAAYAGARCGSALAGRISRDRWRVGSRALGRVLP